MLKNVFSILFLVCFAIYGYAQAPDPNFSDKMALQEKKQFILKSAFQESQHYADYDLVYHRLELKIEPNVNYIQGVVTSYFTSQVENLAEIEFDLNDTLTVDSVLQHRQKISFLQNNDKLLIQLQQPLQNLQLDSVQVFYQGEPKKKGFGSFSKGIHAGEPIIWTLSEPYGAMEWWPCKQSLVDKIDSIDIIVSSPEAYRTGSNGVLVSDTIENGVRKMHWKHRFPITTYLVAFATTNYAVYSDWVNPDNGRKIEILNYVYPENLETAKTETPVTVDFIELYNRIIGEYPFASEKYGHAQFGWSGGMEHQTMSFMAGFGYELIAHELAHQWFGDFITCGSWHDIWLNEGFATYMSGLVYENLQNGKYWYQFKKLNVNRIVSQPDGSVYVQDTTSDKAIFSGRLSYSKGAYLLHMLRWVLGDDHFFEGLRSYFNDPDLQNGFALTHDLQKHMETAGDTTLTEFFNDWFYGEGFPVYSAHFAPVDSGKLKIELSQIPSHSSVDFFEMPVNVRVYGYNSSDSADFRLINTKNNQKFIVDVAFPVANLKIDPDYWLVSKSSLIVSAPEIDNTEECKAYPNPFSDGFSVQIPANQQLVSIKLFSPAGVLIKQFSGNNTNYYFPQIASGLYILRIQTNITNFETQVIKK